MPTITKVLTTESPTRQDNAIGDHSTPKGRIKIVEKVKFWEEQDKINQLLIPRVLEMHEQLKQTSLLAQQTSTTLATLKFITDNLPPDGEQSPEANTMLQQLLQQLANHQKLAQKLADDLQHYQATRAECSEQLRKQINQQSAQINAVQNKTAKGLTQIKRQVSSNVQQLSSSLTDLQTDIQAQFAQHLGKTNQLSNQLAILQTDTQDFAQNTQNTLAFHHDALLWFEYTISRQYKQLLWFGIINFTLSVALAWLIIKEII